MCYSDSDFANDTSTRKSTSGFVLLFGGTAIDWFSKRQSVVALSTAEAEYVAAAEAVKELIVMCNLARELGVCEYPVTLFMDNQSAIRMISDESAQKRTKHIDVKFHFIKSKVNNEFKLEYVPSELQLADIFTKNLPKNKFESMRETLSFMKNGGSVENKHD